jgi:hypothetical protein
MARLNEAYLIYRAAHCSRSKTHHLTQAEFFAFLDECGCTDDHPLGRALATAKKNRKRLYDIHIDLDAQGRPITNACLCSKTSVGGLVPIADEKLRAYKGKHVWFAEGSSVVVKQLGSKLVRNAIIQQQYPNVREMSNPVAGKVSKKKKTKKSANGATVVPVPTCPTCHKCYSPTVHFGYEIYSKWLPKTRKRIAAIQTPPRRPPPPQIIPLAQAQAVFPEADMVAAADALVTMVEEVVAMDIDSVPMDAPMIHQPTDETGPAPLTPPPRTPGGDFWPEEAPMLDVDPHAVCLSDHQVIQVSARVLKTETSLLVESKIIKTEPVVELLNHIPKTTLLDYIHNAASPHLNPSHLVSCVLRDPAAQDSHDLFGPLDRAVRCETDDGRLLKCIWENKLVNDGGDFAGPRILLGKGRTVILAVPLKADSGLHFRFASYYPRPANGIYDRERITFYVGQQKKIATLLDEPTIVVPSGAVLIEVSHANGLRLQVSAIRGGVALLAYSTDLVVDFVPKALRKYYASAGIKVECHMLSYFRRLRVRTLGYNAGVLHFLDERRKVHEAEQRMDDITARNSPLLNGIADFNMLRRSMGMAKENMFPHDPSLLRRTLAMFAQGVEISDSSQQSGILRFVPSQPGAPISILHMITLERGDPIPLLVINGMPFEVMDVTSNYYGHPVNTKDGYEIVPFTSTTDPERIRAIKEYRATLALYHEKCAAQRAYQHEHAGESNKALDAQMSEYHVPLRDAAKRAWDNIAAEGFVIGDFFGAGRHAIPMSGSKKRAHDQVLVSKSSDLPVPSLAKRARYDIEDGRIDFAF